MLDTSARLLRLLSLLQTRRDWTGPQLAERLGVTARTIRNDVERVRSIGYPVLGTPGVAGGYRLGPGSALPPLLLDDDEADQVLPSRLRHRSARATPSRTVSCTRRVGGISRPGTSTDVTGGSTGSTASSRGFPQGRALP